MVKSRLISVVGMGLFLGGCKISVEIPNGGGTVTSNTSINCPIACSENLQRNSTITLQATPQQGYFFGRWEGCDISQSDVCTIQTSDKLAARLVKAHFIEDKSLASVDIYPGLKKRCVFSNSNWGTQVPEDTLISDIEFLQCRGNERWFEDVDVNIRITRYDTEYDPRTGEKNRLCTVEIQNPKTGKSVSVATSFQSISDAFGDDEERRLCNWHLNDEIATPNNQYELMFSEAGIPLDIGDVNPFPFTFNEYPLLGELDSCDDCTQWASRRLRITSYQIKLDGLDKLANLKAIVMAHGDLSDPSPFLAFPHLSVISLYQQALTRVDMLIGLPSTIVELGLEENFQISCQDVKTLRNNFGTNKVFASQCPLVVD